MAKKEEEKKVKPEEAARPEKEAKETAKPEKEAKEEAAKPEKESKVESEDEKLQHLVRVCGVVLDGKLPIERAITKIRGIGPQVASSITPKLGIPSDTKIGLLNEKQIEELEEKLYNLDKHLPAWMVNRRRDLDTGKDIHLIGPDLDMAQREDITMNQKVKSYRGVRHILKLPVRGQRTRSSFRKGATLGVNRRKA